MNIRHRPTSSSDQAIASSLSSIATRHSPAAPPEGAEREACLAELRECAGDRMDLVIQQAGIILGTRVDDEYDPRYRAATGAAEMLLELAEVEEDDERVQQWVAVGRERVERGRIRPEQRREW